MKERFLIGTYTRKSSQGIYVVTLDHDEQLITQVDHVFSINNSSYLGLSKAKHLYSVVRRNDEGGVMALDLNQRSFQEINEITEAGAPPCYIGVDEERQLIYSGNYHTAVINVFRMNRDGSLSQTDHVTHRGSTGPKTEQDSPHVHYCDLTPDNRLVVCDHGMDLTFVYDISVTGKLSEVSRYQSKAGFAPRHIVFHSNGQIAYLLGELESAIEVLKYDANTAKFTHLQTISTVPSDWDGQKSAAAIHITNDGKFVYASNRGRNTIDVFRVESDFRLSFVQSISTTGVFPRDFELSEDEGYLIAANQETDNLTLYMRNALNGELTLVQKDIAVPEGVCVKRWDL